MIILMTLFNAVKFVTLILDQVLSIPWMPLCQDDFKTGFYIADCSETAVNILFLGIYFVYLVVCTIKLRGRL